MALDGGEFLGISTAPGTRKCLGRSDDGRDSGAACDRIRYKLVLISTYC